MSKRYLVIDWELQSVWTTDDIAEEDSGGSCRWGDQLDMIKLVESILEEKKNKAMESRYGKD